jgi:PTH1 family peptidyl-tRNA hydrolase
VKLIVGLGNPGKQYDRTRHNIGFEVLNGLAERLGTAFTREKFRGTIAEGRHGSEKLLLLKPLTFMNVSGVAVAQAARNNVNDPEDIIVIVDDVNLPLGKLRIKSNGSAGGHNGLKSIISHVGTQEFTRLRIGVGLDNTRGDLSDHVLGKFRPDERETVAAMTDRAIEAALRIVEVGVTEAMNEFNG